MNTLEEKKILNALSLYEKEIISIIGGGGKTSLATCISKELNSLGKAVISTTTTKVFPPQMGEGEKLIFISEDFWLNKVDLCLREKKLVHLAVEILPQGKLKGLSTKLCNDLLEKTNLDYLIIEADGSKGKSIKAHSRFEPVVPDFTTLLIPVIGIDCLGQKISDNICHRSKLFCSMLGISSGTIIDTNLIYNLFKHPDGYLKTLPPKARAFVFINKVHELMNFREATKLGEKLLSLDRIDRVLIGHLKGPVEKITFMTKSER